MFAYKDLPVLIIRDFLSREASREHCTDGTKFHIGKIELVANTDVYVDSLFHCFAKGSDLSELLLKSLANLPGIVVCATDTGQAIDVDSLCRLELSSKAGSCIPVGRVTGTGPVLRKKSLSYRQCSGLFSGCRCELRRN